jgi:hypothetical protein
MSRRLSINFGDRADRGTFQSVVDIIGMVRDDPPRSRQGRTVEKKAAYFRPLFASEFPELQAPAMGMVAQSMGGKFHQHSRRWRIPRISLDPMAVCPFEWPPSLSLRSLVKRGRNYPLLTSTVNKRLGPIQTVDAPPSSLRDTNTGGFACPQTESKKRDSFASCADKLFEFVCRWRTRPYPRNNLKRPGQQCAEVPAPESQALTIFLWRVFCT